MKKIIVISLLSCTVYSVLYGPRSKIRETLTSIDPAIRNANAQDPFRNPQEELPLYWVDPFEGFHAHPIIVEAVPREHISLNQINVWKEQNNLSNAIVNADYYDHNNFYIARPQIEDINWNHMEINNTDFHHLIFTNTRISNVTFRNCIFRDVTLSGANLQNNDFDNITLENVDFTNANLTGSIFYNIIWNDNIRGLLDNHTLSAGARENLRDAQNEFQRRQNIQNE